jgi:hypothetical protein
MTESNIKNDKAQCPLAPATCSASEVLTSEQIQNWRNVLIGLVGPYAEMMSSADVQKFRDKLSSHGL